MKRIPVESSDLKSVGYEEETSLLEVEFLSDTVYQYSRVPKSVYLELMSAPSHGRYFARNIKDNPYYSCCRIYPNYEVLRV